MDELAEVYLDADALGGIDDTAVWNFDKADDDGEALTPRIAHTQGCPTSSHLTAALVLQRIHSRAVAIGTQRWLLFPPPGRLQN